MVHVEHVASPHCSHFPKHRGCLHCLPPKQPKLAAALITFDGCVQLQVLPDRHVPEQDVLLGTVAQLAPHLQSIRHDAVPQHQGVTLSGLRQAGEHADSCGLASACRQGPKQHVGSQRCAAIHTQGRVQ